MRLFRQVEFWLIVAAAAVLTAGHYTASQHDPFWHDLFRRLYYLPIILAGFRYGLRGGLITAAAVSMVFFPHILMTQRMLHVQASEARFEIPLYLIIGTVTGVLADRQRRATESLRRSERLKALGETAAGVAHEIKNPLAAIRSSAQMLADTGRPGDRGRSAGRSRELVGIITSEVDRLNRVVNQLLQYARPAPVERRREKLSRVLETCAGLLRPVAAKKRLGLARHYPGDEPEVEVDPDQMQQVFLNLLLNAIEASPQGGQVDISVGPQGRWLSASVADRGPGIPRDRLGRVFEPFFTTREGGSGLGLAIAQRIVTEHGGRLELESEPGRGTTARVLLPRRPSR